MKIVYAASEVAPFVKTGGLGDVAGALPFELSQFPGVEVHLFLPYYGLIKRNGKVQTEKVAEFYMPLSWRNQYVGLYRVKSRKRKLRMYLIDNEYYFDREELYGHEDDGERFAYFSKAVLESLFQMNLFPDIIHCNDWQTALIPTLLHGFYEAFLGKAKTVFSIHNVEYQGWVHPYFLGDVLGLDDSYDSTFQFHGKHNLMKSAILSCDALSTVSRTYADEICDPYFAHGLDHIIREHAFKLKGIVNGIDFASNDPMNDPFLERNYDASSFREGKAACKTALQKELGLSVREDVPLVGMVSRLVSHKGMEILCDALEEWGDWDIQFALLGTGDPQYEEKIRALAARFPSKIAASLCFNKALASRIYSGSDLYLMPSKSEPCGLSQLIAMRYGAVPVVHETGGLKDTVIPFDPNSGEGLGFTFSQFSKDDLNGALRRALTVFACDRKAWEKIAYNGMTADFCWKKPALEYLSLYESIIELNPCMKKE